MTKTNARVIQIATAVSGGTAKSSYAETVELFALTDDGRILRGFRESGGRYEWEQVKLPTEWPS